MKVHARLKVGVDPKRQIRKLTTALKNRSMRIAMNAASAPVKAATISHAPKRYGYLAKAQRIRLRQYKASSVWVSVVGPSRSFVRVKGKRTRGKHKGEGIKHRPANYGRLLDHGTKHIPALNFMAAAKAQGAPSFSSILTERLKREIDSILS